MAWGRLERLCENRGCRVSRFDVRKGRVRSAWLVENPIPTTTKNFDTIETDKGQPESSGCGGIVFALSDGSNPVTFVVYGTRREFAKRICG